MIDIHMHIGKLYIGEKTLTPSHLLKFMDKNGIEKAVILPVESPEETHYYVTTNYVLNICRRYPDRFIPFCNIDPRHGNSDASTDYFKDIVWTILNEYSEKGCKGYGEAMSGLCIDDPRLQVIYEFCGKLNMPIIFHMDKLRNIDQIGLPGFENMIKKFPQTIFVGHAMTFWSEISSDVDEETRGGYPKGKIEKEGKLQELFRKYPNLYGDLSAGSGFNAITRDPDYGYKFLEEFQDKLLFGTDLCRFYQEVPIISYIKEAVKDGKISRVTYDKITEENARRILKL